MLPASYTSLYLSIILFGSVFELVRYSAVEISLFWLSKQLESGEEDFRGYVERVPAISSDRNAPHGLSDHEVAGIQAFPCEEKGISSLGRRFCRHVHKFASRMFRIYSSARKRSKIWLERVSEAVRYRDIRNLG